MPFAVQKRGHMTKSMMKKLMGADNPKQLEEKTSPKLATRRPSFYIDSPK